jgi:hypothetical protein
MVKLKSENFQYEYDFLASVRKLRENNQNMRLLIHTKGLTSETVNVLLREARFPHLTIDKIKIKDYGYIRYQVVVKY